LRRRAVEQKTEREWKTIVCAEGKERIAVMCEWDIVSKGGRIFRKTLKQIDCHHPKLAEFGGIDCNWGCGRIITKREKQDL
jgi:hypothetical protein